MAGDGPKKESFPTSLDGVIQAGFTSKGNLTDGLFIIIIQSSCTNNFLNLLVCIFNEVTRLGFFFLYYQRVETQI